MIKGRNTKPTFDEKREYEKQMHDEINGESYHFPFANLAEALTLDAIELLADTDNATDASKAGPVSEIEKLLGDYF
ncbi:hypothetical protein [uncultured Pontibacter sp.]|uniref:hypothetical protein n=1 Tax=uncultured Pontibacter sp. TaxID=453356 RepID=UPI0026278878|nr:hypothetical protein [uncultured Pontibacter sp.]